MHTASSQSGGGGGWGMSSQFGGMPTSQLGAGGSRSLQHDTSVPPPSMQPQSGAAPKAPIKDSGAPSALMGSMQFTQPPPQAPHKYKQPGGGLGGLSQAGGALGGLSQHSGMSAHSSSGAGALGSLQHQYNQPSMQPAYLNQRQMPSSQFKASEIGINKLSFTHRQLIVNACRPISTISSNS